MKHTPGPWLCTDKTVYALQDCIFANKPSQENRFFAGVQGKAPEPELKANARLMKAVPDLLDACQSALVAMAGTDWRVKEVLRTAIEKATEA